MFEKVVDIYEGQNPQEEKDRWIRIFMISATSLPVRASAAYDVQNIYAAVNRTN